MDMLMKLLMGGWIPQGQRTQWASFAVALGAVATAVVEWGSGTMGLVDLLKEIAEKWPVLVPAYIAYFLAEKVDARP